MLKNIPKGILSTQQNKIIIRTTLKFLDIGISGIVMRLEKRARGIFSNCVCIASRHNKNYILQIKKNSQVF